MMPLILVGMTLTAVQVDPGPSPSSVPKSAPAEARPARVHLRVRLSRSLANEAASGDAGAVQTGHFSAGAAVPVPPSSGDAIVDAWVTPPNPGTGAASEQ